MISKARNPKQAAVRLAFALFIPLPAVAQAITAGVTGGVPLTQTFNTPAPGDLYREEFAPKTVRYTIGASIDFRVRGNLRAEVDVLYQPFSFVDNGYVGTPTFTRTSGNLWQ